MVQVAKQHPGEAASPPELVRAHFPPASPMPQLPLPSMAMEDWGVLHCPHAPEYPQDHIQGAGWDVLQVGHSHAWPTATCISPQGWRAMGEGWERVPRVPFGACPSC